MNVRGKKVNEGYSFSADLAPDLFICLKAEAGWSFDKCLPRSLSPSKGVLHIFSASH